MARRTEHALRREVSSVSKLLWERGWVANHDGNVTARFAPGRILATPTALSKRVIGPDLLLVVDESRRVVRGRLQPFSELGLHLTVYAARADVGAVVHAHPPHATARALTGRALPSFLPEAVVSIGAELPVVPFAAPGAPAEKALAGFPGRYDVVLLEQHGALAWGDDPEQAFLRLELAEHLCRIAHLAGGEPRPLPNDLVDALIRKRRAAGLDPAAR